MDRTLCRYVVSTSKIMSTCTWYLASFRYSTFVPPIFITIITNVYFRRSSLPWSLIIINNHSKILTNKNYYYTYIYELLHQSINRGRKFELLFTEQGSRHSGVVGPRFSSRLVIFIIQSFSCGLKCIKKIEFPHDITVIFLSSRHNMYLLIFVSACNNSRKQFYMRIASDVYIFEISYFRHTKMYMKQNSI